MLFLYIHRLECMRFDYVYCMFLLIPQFKAVNDFFLCVHNNVYRDSYRQVSLFNKCHTDICIVYPLLCVIPLRYRTAHCTSCYHGKNINWYKLNRRQSTGSYVVERYVIRYGRTKQSRAESHFGILTESLRNFNI